MMSALIHDPNVTFLLFVVALIGLYVEISHPGVIFPGVTGGIALLLFFLAAGSLSPNWVGLALMAFAFVLLVLDVRLPSHGVLTVGAVTSLIFGALLFFQSGGPQPGPQFNPLVVYIAGVVVGLIGLSLVTVMARVQRRPVTTGTEGMIGAIVVTSTALLPEGRVSYQGEDWMAIVLVLLLLLFSAIRVVQQYERGVIFVLGRLIGAKGPGIFLVPPFISRMTNVVNFLQATTQIGQTALRNVLGQSELDELLSQRNKINRELQTIIDEHTERWGVKVTAVEIKDIELPATMQRAMAKQAEAEREKRAKIIHAQGELQASNQLAQAASVIGVQPAALQLRYLQTLTEIAVEKNSTIVFPLPIDLIEPMIDLLHRNHATSANEQHDHDGDVSALPLYPQQ